MRFLKRMIVGYLVFVLYLWFAKWLEVLGVSLPLETTNFQTMSNLSMLAATGTALYGIIYR